eukprot:3797923-Rhodomonas_salina.1
MMILIHRDPQAQAPHVLAQARTVTVTGLDLYLAQGSDDSTSRTKRRRNDSSSISLHSRAFRFTGMLTQATVNCMHGVNSIRFCFRRFKFHFVFENLKSFRFRFVTV